MWTWNSSAWSLIIADLSQSWRIWWCRRGEGDKRGVQDMEEKHSFPVRPGYDPRIGVAQPDCSVAAWCLQVRTPDVNIHCSVTMHSCSTDEMLFCAPGRRGKTTVCIGWCWALTHLMSRTTWSSPASSCPTMTPSLMPLITTVKKEVGNFLLHTPTI